MAAVSSQWGGSTSRHLPLVLGETSYCPELMGTKVLPKPACTPGHQAAPPTAAAAALSIVLITWLPLDTLIHLSRQSSLSDSFRV